jgi:hypothetical protein
VQSTFRQSSSSSHVRLQPASARCKRPPSTRSWGTRSWRCTESGTTCTRGLPGLVAMAQSAAAALFTHGKLAGILCAIALPHTALILVAKDDVTIPMHDEQVARRQWALTPASSLPSPGSSSSEESSSTRSSTSSWLVLKAAAAPPSLSARGLDVLDLTGGTGTSWRTCE